MGSRDKILEVSEGALVTFKLNQMNFALDHLVIGTLVAMALFVDDDYDFETAKSTAMEIVKDEKAQEILKDIMERTDHTKDQALAEMEQKEQTKH